MSFKIKKAYLLGVGNWLNDQQLGGAKSRARTRFVAQIQEALNAVDKERVGLLESNAEKNEDGSVKMEDGDNGKQYVLSDEAQHKVAKEYGEILTEDWIVDVTDANKEQMGILKDIVLNSEYQFGPREGEPAQSTQMRIRQMNDYPEWCRAFEEI